VKAIESEYSTKEQRKGKESTKVHRNSNGKQNAPDFFCATP